MLESSTSKIHPFKRCKVTNKRGKYKMKACFYFYFRAEVTYRKLQKFRLNEQEGNYISKHITVYL